VLLPVLITHLTVTVVTMLLTEVQLNFPVHHVGLGGNHHGISQSPAAPLHGK
jgi:hypothetical protein